MFASKRIHIPYWIALALLLLWCDYLMGPYIQFPITYLIPIIFATWYSGRGWGLALAIIMPLVRAHFVSRIDVPWTMFETCVNAAIRISILSFVVILVSRERQLRILQQHVRVLEGFLPTCSFCKKIRCEGDQWVPLERYIASHSEAEFTHGVCPECAKKQYPELYKGTGKGTN